MIKIRKGLDLPITGAPEQKIISATEVKSVALVGADYVGMKPTMSVKVGDRVKLGQLIFTDKKTEGVRYTAPGAGIVSAINRGARRVLESVVIELDKTVGAETFAQYSVEQLPELTANLVKDNLVASGLWTAFRTRPFSRVPAIDTTADAIFVTAMDTNPLAADPAIIISEQAESFKQGLQVLRQLTDKAIYLCQAPDVDLPSIDSVQVETFSGIHPAGNVGTHIHFLAGASQSRVVWSIGYQDVIAFGQLFTTGQLPTERVISIAGPKAKQPGLYRTRLGASTDELVAHQLTTDNTRVISGSVWNGFTAGAGFAYLGRYANQLSLLEEGNEREFIGWLVPGSKKFSVLNVFSSFLSFGKKKFDFTTTTNGSERAMVPVGQFEQLMPLDILPTQLLRALVTGDIVLAMQLGCLELDEEDLALCTFACSGKYEYGSILRDNLTRIEKET